jgi:hypothetical protein
MNGSKNKSKFRIDFRILSILSLIAAIPLLVGSWLLFKSYESASLELVGSNLSESADMVFTQLNSYLQNQIIVVAGLNEVPVIREVVKKGNQDLTKNLEEVRKAIPAMESRWPSLDGNAPELKTILDNQASDFLRRYSAIEKSLREIMVTDYLGRLVAATGKTSDFYQADEDWWKECYGDGRRGSVYVGDVSYDASARVYSIDLAQPLVEPGGGVIGVIKVVLDAQDIHSLIGSIRMGPSTSAALIHAKGTVISAPGYSILDQATYPGTLEILNARERGRRYFVSSTSPASIIGMTDTKTQENFRQQYPHLNWILVMTGPVDSILGPLKQLRRYVMALDIAIVLVTLVATLILSGVESRPVVEQDPHLERL